MVLLLGLFVVVLRIAHGDVVRAPLGGEVETVQVARIIRIVPLSTLSLNSGSARRRRVSQYDVVADHHRRERRRDMGAAQSEDHGALVRERRNVSA